MANNTQFYIGGEWREPEGGQFLTITDPATEAIAGRVAAASLADVDRAVAAARNAFETYSRTSVDERLALLDRLAAAYDKRVPDLARAITAEVGAPRWLAEQMQAVLAGIHIRVARDALARYRFSEPMGAARILKEPIGVCAFITPWNWPLNQIGSKVAPALAVGCTMVLKPSEIAPSSATIFAEIVHDAGVPAGVFNLVHGDGPRVGAALSAHPAIDMVSFTGSTRAGIEVARAAANTVKRVHQELGGKSANIVLRSADLSRAVSHGVAAVMLNSGQSCNAPTRMLVPRERMEEAKRLAKAAAGEQVPGNPNSNAKLGPVVSERQWDKIQSLIGVGMAEGATLIAGGLGRPEGLGKGYYVKPTIFADVTNDMTIAREEIFGPVLAILAYDSEEEAIRIANDTPYGLAAYVQGEHGEAQAVAARLRAGQVVLNGAPFDFNTPFGGYKQSGNGREWGEHAFAEFLEVKAIVGNAIDENATA
ncbi:aldehyde dehydrogenase family protein [Bradyrhizobium manausense]